MRDLWHFHFYGEVPPLVKGRERSYFEHFWNDFAADAKHSVSEADRRVYANAYAQPDGMRAGIEYFRNFEQDAKDFAQLGATPLPMSVLVLTGEKASGNFLIEQAKMVATNVQGQIIPGSGHWLMEEAPQTTIPALHHLSKCQTMNRLDSVSASIRPTAKPSCEADRERDLHDFVRRSLRLPGRKGIHTNSPNPTLEGERLPSIVQFSSSR